MKIIIGVLLLASGALAQRAGFVGTGPRGSNYGSRHGFGNVVFPGTGRAPNALPSAAFPTIPPGRVDPGFAYQLGATVSGYPPYTGAATYGRGRGFPIAYPIAYPVPYAVYTEPAPPTATVIYPQAAPPVVINQYFTPEVAKPAVIQEIEPSGDGIRVFGPSARQSSETSTSTEEKRSYLIALKDHTIYAAFAYWFEGDTLHYVTTHGTHNQASMDLVDRELTERLNRERNVPFKLK